MSDPDDATTPTLDPLDETISDSFHIFDLCTQTHSRLNALLQQGFLDFARCRMEDGFGSLSCIDGLGLKTEAIGSARAGIGFHVDEEVGSMVGFSSWFRDGEDKRERTEEVVVEHGEDEEEGESVGMRHRHGKQLAVSGGEEEEDLKSDSDAELDSESESGSSSSVNSDPLAWTGRWRISTHVLNARKRFREAVGLVAELATLRTGLIQAADLFDEAVSCEREEDKSS